MAAFALRFWPLWSVWLLIFAIPVSREVLQLHTLGSPLVSLYDQPWRESWRRGSEFNSSRAAKAHPRDLNVRLWRFSLRLQNLRAGTNLEIDKMVREAKAMGAAFPREKWLVALPVRVIALGTTGAKNHGSRSQALASKIRTRQWIALIQNAARFEPNNAFYPFVEAMVWRHTFHQTRALEALKRAARCREFDAHNLEIARAVVAAHEAIRPLILEEKLGVWQEHNQSIFKAPYWQQDVGGWVAYFVKIVHHPKKRGDHRRVIETGVLMARLGHLMQRGTNTLDMARVGNNWKNEAWHLAPRSKAQRRVVSRLGFLQYQSRDFARYAALHGRPDVAALVPKWAARQRELSNDLNTPPSLQSPYLVRRDALWRAGWWRDAGAFVGMHLLFVAAFWLVANGFLWRAGGAPSTHRARVLPALFWAILATALAWWTWFQFDQLDNSTWNITQAMRQVAAGSVGVFAFFAAPFVLALWCACATMAKNKARFSQPTRLQTEMRLFPVEAGLLKVGAMILCLLAIAATFTVWAAFLILAWNGTRSFDLFGWLPDAAKGASFSYSISTEWLFAPLLYFLLLDWLCFLLWFAKWRWFGGRDNRALTHGGLRGWKESLGLYLVFASLIYLGTALAAWPSRTAAHRELELRLTRGELPAATPK